MSAGGRWRAAPNGELIYARFAGLIPETGEKTVAGLSAAAGLTKQSVFSSLNRAWLTANWSVQFVNIAQLAATLPVDAST